MNISIGVVAHTSRGAEAKALARLVGASFISIDNGILGCDQNHQVVQQHLAGLGGDWAVVLEDDAQPVDGFRDQLAAALEVAPTPVVSLYLGMLRPPQFQRRIVKALDQADLQGAHWLTSSRMLHAVGYAIRADVLPSLLDFESDLPADERIGAWSSHKICYCVPSLLDHADWPTIVQHRDKQVREPGRTAWRTGSRPVWNANSVPLTT